MDMFLVVMIFLMAVEFSYQLPIESLDDVLVHPVEPATNPHKRQTNVTGGKQNVRGFDKFVEEKLIQHSQALETVVEIVRRNEEITKNLVDNLSNRVPEPKMPEKVELLSRRSLNGPTSLAPSQLKLHPVSPWCSVAMACRRAMNPVCGYDDNYGYGKFDDICHMFQVNCYWKYNFGLSPNCKPSP